MFRATRLLAILAAIIALGFDGLSTAPTLAEAATTWTVAKSEYWEIKNGRTRAKIKKITKCSAYEGQSQTPIIKLYEYFTPGDNHVFISVRCGEVLDKSRVPKRCWPERR